MRKRIRKSKYRKGHLQTILHVTFTPDADSRGSTAHKCDDLATGKRKCYWDMGHANYGNALYTCANLVPNNPGLGLVVQESREELLNMKNWVGSGEYWVGLTTDAER